MTESELRAFFADYGAAFLQSEAEIAEFYNAPCITARQGAVRLNTTRQDVRLFFGEMLRGYRAHGAVQGDLRNLTWMSLGANATAATVTWAYKNAADQLLWE